MDEHEFYTDNEWGKDEEGRVCRVCSYCKKEITPYRIDRGKASEFWFQCYCEGASKNKKYL